MLGEVSFSFFTKKVPMEQSQKYERYMFAHFFLIILEVLDKILCINQCNSHGQLHRYNIRYSEPDIYAYGICTATVKQRSTLY